MPLESSENSYVLEVPDIASLPSVSVAERKSLPTCGGVYIVSSGIGAVLYVGSSKNLRSRWVVHHRRHQLVDALGARIAWIVVEHTPHRMALEQHCIEALHPLYQHSLVPPRPDGKGRLVRKVFLQLPESTYVRLSESAIDYDRTLSNQIIFILKRLIASGQLDKWARSPNERSSKGNRLRRRLMQSTQLSLVYKPIGAAP